MNAAIDRLRADQRRRKREETSVIVSFADGDSERHLQRTRVRAAISALRSSEAQLLIARLSGWTYREIATALNRRVRDRHDDFPGRKIIRKGV